MKNIRIDKVYFAYAILRPGIHKLLAAYFFKQHVPAEAQHVEIKTPNEVMIYGDSLEQEAMARAILLRQYRTVLVGDETPEKMAHAISKKAYWDEVQGDAQSIWDDIKSRDIETRDDLYMRLNEIRHSLDDHEVLQHTSNEDACTRTHGMPLDKDNPVGDLAYWAYYQDVFDTLCELGCKPNATKLGRCEDCDGHGYVEYSKDVIVPCAECEKFNSRREAIEQALADREINPCSACCNFGCFEEEETVTACEACGVFASDEEAAEFVMEYGKDED